MTRPQLVLIGALSLLSTVIVLVAGGHTAESVRAIRAAAERAITVAAALPATVSATPVAAPVAAAPLTESVPAAPAPATVVAQPDGGDTESDEHADEDAGDSAALKPSQIGHVFVIALTSPGYDETWGKGSPATYLTQTLRPQGTLLSGFAPLDRAALPNYLGAIGGQPPNPATRSECATYEEFKTGAAANDAGIVSGRGCAYPNTVLTLADQVSSSGKQWKAYVGDQASGPETEADTCRHPYSDERDLTAHGRLGDQYATRTNPFVYFHSLLDLGACFTQDVDLTALSDDLKRTRTTPNLSFISPNLCDSGTEAPCVDGRPGGLATADEFLSEWVPQIQNSPAYVKDGLIVVAFLSPATTVGTVSPDAGPTGATGPSGPHGPVAASTARVSGGLPPTGLLLVSQYADPSATDSTRYDPYSLLRTLEDTFGLEPLAKAKDAESFKGQIATAFGG